MLELLLDTLLQTASLPQLLTSSADALGRSPLHFAAANGDYGAAQLLIARGADVNVSSLGRQTRVPQRAAVGIGALLWAWFLEAAALDANKCS